MRLSNESELLATLERSKAELIRASQGAGASGQWDDAEQTLRWAREIDGMMGSLKHGGTRSLPALGAAVSSQSTMLKNLPYHYIQNNKLVHRGANRNQAGVYEHRVPREHYDLVVEHLSAMAHDGSFDTVDLIKRCDLPAHEPRIVLKLLEESKLLTSARRGRWLFANAETFQADVEIVWPSLPRE